MKGLCAFSKAHSAETWPSVEPVAGATEKEPAEVEAEAWQANSRLARVEGPGNQALWPPMVPAAAAASVVVAAAAAAMTPSITITTTRTLREPVEQVASAAAVVVRAMRSGS